MEQTNSFQGGLNKDIAKVLQQSNTYLDLQNMRILTDEGGTTGALINVKGNVFGVRIPDTTQEINLFMTEFGTNIIFTLNALVAEFTTTNIGCANYVAYFTELKAFLLANFSSLGLTIGFVDTGVCTTSYLKIQSTTAITVFTGTNFGSSFISTVSGAPPQTNLEIIGWTTIRDTFVLLTTNNTSKNPGGHDPNLSTDASSYGQIWTLTYDKTDPVNTLTFSLKYNNLVDFTAYHPVPSPGAIVGNYENSLTQKIYWTDNFNRYRSFNVADPNGFGLDVSLLDIEPQIDMSVPILQEITSTGALKVGAYQTAYRLKNFGGATTVFSPLSNVVSIVPFSEQSSTAGSNFKDYIGAAVGTTTSKAIRWKVDGLDTDFERIEIVAIYRETPTSAPVIELVFDEPIPDSGSFEYTYTGNEADPIQLTLTEFLTFESSFTHGKCLTASQNHLIPANTRVVKQDFDFDARVYRFDNTRIAVIEDSQGNTEATILGTGPVYPTTETLDAINPDHDIYRYRTDGTTLGGDGPNISYEFGTIAVRGDSTIELITGSQQIAPFRHTNPMYSASSISLGINGQNYPTNQINDGMKYPYLSSLLKGYVRGEIYRFGIEFYDKQGRQTFAKWIGDIKMPELFDLCPAANRKFEDGTAQGTVPDYRTSFTIGDECWLNLLHVKFNVTVPAALTEQIGGFSIVRVDRTNADKTIVAQGIVFPTEMNTNALWVPRRNTFADLNSVTGGTNTRLINPMLQAPDFLHNGFPGVTAGDALKLVARLSKYNANVDVDPSGGAADLYRMEKLYTQQGVLTLTNPYPISVAEIVPFGGTSGIASGAFPFYNYDRASANTSAALGTDTLFMETTVPLDYATDGIASGTYRRFLANYTRSLTLQYGGNTYSQRSNNQYINCNVFQFISKTSSSNTYTLSVYGGDTFITIYDNQKEIKNWAQTSRGTAANKYSYTSFFAVETAVNTELRYGLHVNKDLDNDAGTDASAYETYDHNTVYSTNNDLVTFVAKPVDFVSVTENDNRVWASEPKISGEATDSWGIFKTNNYRDVDSTYGPINGVGILEGELMFWQDRAFGVIPVNQRVLVPTSTSALSTLQIGAGDILEVESYVSTKTGSKHQWGICFGEASVFWYDALASKFYRYSKGGKEPLSDVKGLQAWFPTNLTGRIQTTDNQIYKNPSYNNNRCGIHCVYDYRYNEAVFTFIDSQRINGVYTEVPYTLAYGDQTGTFIGYYTHYPNLYLSDKHLIFSPNPGANTDLYIHDLGAYGTFYGTKQKSSVKLIFNPYPSQGKVFNSVSWLTEVLDTTSSSNDINIGNKTWDRVRYYNDYQNTDFQTLTLNTNVKRKERNWQMAIPRNVLKNTVSNVDIFNSANFDTTRLFRERLRDKYLTVDLEYNNTDGYKLVFPLIQLNYAISAR